jgi:cell division septal protein FtsQ
VTRSRSRSDVRRRAHRVVIATMAVLLLAFASSLFWGPYAARELSRALIAGSSHFRVAQVYVVGNRRLATPLLLDLAKVRKGDALFGVPCAAVKARVEKHSWIRCAQVRRHFPDAIEIRVWEREPAAALRGNGMMVVTTDSVVVAPLLQNWSWDLPILTPPRVLNVADGQRLRDPMTLAMLREVLKVRNVSSVAWHNLSELYVSDTDMRAVLNKPPIELLLGRGVGELDWIAALRLVQENQRNGNMLCQRVDLRVPGKVILGFQPLTSREPISG